MQRIIPLLALLLCAGCGVPDIEDDRPFAKPPLADPDLLWQGEPETATSELGEPRRQVPLGPDGTPRGIGTSPGAPEAAAQEPEPETDTTQASPAAMSPADSAG